MERGDDLSSHHIRVYQTLDPLEKGIDFLPFGTNGTIALALWCFSEEVTSVRRQGCISVAPKV
jgi:hypothetical protein